MKVVCVKKFKDKNTGKVYVRGDKFTVNKERFEELVKAKGGPFAEEYKETENK